MLERIGRVVGPVVLQRDLDRLAQEPPEALTAQDLALRAFDAIVAAARWVRGGRRDVGGSGRERFAPVWWM